MPFCVEENLDEMPARGLGRHTRLGGLPACVRELHDILAFRRSHDDIEPDKCAISTTDVKQTQCITHDRGHDHDV
jgi:hypothetical protein